ncbi:MAG TPA: hypothetical protein PLG34_07860 [Spirochaetota bacterium]|nr:hypothetical protein [Spirochaetota bacterium]HPY87883.1 hypothetical protein [Spirochaetota bacterium]
MKDKNPQMAMKYFYFASKHYQLFLENIDKAKIYEEEMKKQNEKK